MVREVVKIIKAVESASQPVWCCKFLTFPHHRALVGRRLSGAGRLILDGFYHSLLELEWGWGKIKVTRHERRVVTPISLQYPARPDHTLLTAVDWKIWHFCGSDLALQEQWRSWRNRGKVNPGGGKLQDCRKDCRLQDVSGNTNRCRSPSLALSTGKIM